MNAKDRAAAVLALYDWFRSQDLNLTDGVEVMIVATVGILMELAKNNETSLDEGARIVINMLKTTVDENR